MRVTNSMMISSMLENIQNNQERVSNLQGMISSGKKLRRPSDDPVAVSTALTLRSNERSIDQYRRNVDAARNWIQTSEAAVRSSLDVIHRARELAVLGSNGTLSGQQRQNVAQEVDQLFSFTIELGNAKVGGQYVFAGYQVNTRPFAAAATPSGYVYQGDAGQIEREIGINTKIRVNSDGDAVFGGTLAAIKSLSTALNTNDTAAIQASLSALDAQLNAVLGRMAEIGASNARLDLADERLQDVAINNARQLSGVQDVDMAKVLLEHTGARNVYDASLKVGAQVVQPSLLDYLR